MPTAGLGVGVKLDLASHLAMRFDRRFYAVFKSSAIVQFCGSDGCETVLKGRAMRQGEVAASLVLEF
jgi:hypothetical protein